MFHIRLHYRWSVGWLLSCPLLDTYSLAHLSADVKGYTIVTFVEFVLYNFYCYRSYIIWIRDSKTEIRVCGQCFGAMIISRMHFFSISCHSKTDMVASIQAVYNWVVILSQTQVCSLMCKDNVFVHNSSAPHIVGAKSNGLAHKKYFSSLRHIGALTKRPCKHQCDFVNLPLPMQIGYDDKMLQVDIAYSNPCTLEYFWCLNDWTSEYLDTRTFEWMHTENLSMY